MDLSNFRNDLVRTGDIQVEGQSFTSKHIIETLENILTDERKTRIEQVLEGRTWNCATIVEGLHDVGNISAVMRSAESFGFVPFHVIEAAGAKYKKSERTSKGSEKWLDFKKHKDPKACINGWQEQGYQVLAATLEGGKDIATVDFSKPTALLFGNEKDGVSPEALKHVDGRFFVPMKGFTQSFNISVAAAISFYHAYQERFRIFDKSGDLTVDENRALRAQYYLRTVSNPKTILGLLDRKVDG